MGSLQLHADYFESWPSKRTSLGFWGIKTRPFTLKGTRYLDVTSMEHGNINSKNRGTFTQTIWLDRGFNNFRSRCQSKLK